MSVGSSILPAVLEQFLLSTVELSSPDLQRPLISLTYVDGSSSLGSRLIPMFTCLGQKVVDEPRTVRIKAGLQRIDLPFFERIYPTAQDGIKGHVTCSFHRESEAVSQPSNTTMATII